ncbi:MAG: hypothetical protein WD069_20275 [Planctomycetales bacterium]
MNINVIDLSEAHESARDDLSGLHAYLAQLIGQPFRFARVSYGDELTLHFGDLRPGSAPARSHALYGAYVLGVRASPWLLKSANRSLMLNSEGAVPSASGTIGKRELETGEYIASESPVFEATPFMIAPVDAIGLRLRMADGSELEVVPGPPAPDEPEDESLPEVADWELLSPAGHLSVGPKLRWWFMPTQPTKPAMRPSEAASIAGKQMRAKKSTKSPELGGKRIRPGKGKKSAKSAAFGIEPERPAKGKKKSAKHGIKKRRTRTRSRKV